MRQIKVASPLRYPGGKSRVAGRISSLFPDFDEYREPFIGGGSVFLELAQRKPMAKYWINDLYPDVSNFWYTAATDLSALVQHVIYFRELEKDGKRLYSRLRELEPESNVQRAARFFALNRITFSGTLDSGGYSQLAFEKRFTETSVQRLRQLSFLQDIDVRVTNSDYSEVIRSPGSGVLLYLDPPYITRGRKLYGRGGDLHRKFDHERFTKTALESEHTWLITYNDGDSINKLLPESANLSHLHWQQHYPMKSSLGSSLPKGQELIIANYDLEGLSL